MRVWRRISLELSHSWPGQLLLRFEAPDGPATMVEVGPDDLATIQALKDRIGQTDPGRNPVDRLAELELDLEYERRVRERLRLGYDALVNQVIAALSTEDHHMVTGGGLPHCKCRRSLGGGKAQEEFITHALAFRRSAPQGGA